MFTPIHGVFFVSVSMRFASVDGLVMSPPSEPFPLALARVSSPPPPLNYSPMIFFTLKSIWGIVFWTLGANQDVK